MLASTSIRFAAVDPFCSGAYPPMTIFLKNQVDIYSAHYVQGAVERSFRNIGNAASLTRWR
jgi:hypothetical protein